MNKGYLGGFISSEFTESDINLKDGTTMKKVKFSIACNRKSKDKSADFVWVTAIGKTAENIIRFFGKGKGILVEYHIQTGSYKNKEGNNVYTEDKIIDSFEFPYLRKSDVQGDSADFSAQTVNNTSEQGNAGNEPPKAPEDSFMDIPTEAELGELPFR